MTTAIDYLGRTIDLLAFAGAQPSGDVLLTPQLAFAAQSGQITAGIQKLVQRFLLELLTESGSLAYLPTRGCDFMIDALAGIWRTQIDVQQSFYSAMIDVGRNLTLEESVSDSADERFGSAELLNVVLTADKVSIQVAVTSLAGSSRTVLMPISVII